MRILLILQILRMVSAFDGICVGTHTIIEYVTLAGDVTERTRDVPIDVCCSGYQNVSGNCEPICDPKCISGTCVSPQKCECYDGYKGSLCNELIFVCKAGLWGSECQFYCDCETNECDHQTGKCILPSTEPPCSCEMKNIESCDDGKCKCKPGWTGEKCEKSCEKGYFGTNCESQCTHYGFVNYICDPINGDTCKDNYKGDNCDICKCINGSCNSITGECDCEPGFWGNFCQNGCNCGNNECNNKTGKCAVTSTSPSIVRDNKQCSCKTENTEFCEDGKCKCNPGWTGEKCDEPCEEGYYGANCELKCAKYGFVNYVCNPVTGDTCKDSYEGENCDICKCKNGSCDPLTGECDCDSGFGEKDCSPCQTNKYGKNCRFSCICDNCRKTDGYCKCQEGWKGSECADYCPSDLHNKTSGLCFDRSPHGIVISWLHLAYIGGAVVILILIITIGITIFNRCKRSDFKEDTMINTSAKKVVVPPPHAPIRISSLNQYEEGGPVYETIPDGSIPPEYSPLVRIDEFGERFLEDQYYRGYEQPRGIRQNTPLQITSEDYVQLNRNSIQPSRVSTNLYYKFPK